MRRRKEKKPKLFSKQNVVGLIIVVIMVSSILGMINLGEEDNDDYNGHVFTRAGSDWYTTIEGNYVRFRFHPSIVDEIYLPYTATDTISNTKMVYITFDPDDKNVQYIEQIRLELEEEMPKLFKTYVVTGVSNITQSYEDFILISCDNATASVPVIMFASEKNESFEYRDNCLIVRANTGNDMMIMKDRLVLGLSGIIE